MALLEELKPWQTPVRNPGLLPPMGGTLLGTPARHKANVSDSPSDNHTGDLEPEALREVAPPQLAHKSEFYTSQCEKMLLTWLPSVAAMCHTAVTNAASHP